MPIYEYECTKCEVLVEDIVPLDRCDDVRHCMTCSREMVKVLSVPQVRMGASGVCKMGDWRSSQVSNGKSAAIQTWDSTRRFPNLAQAGDGTMSFPTKRAYESYLTTEGIQEMSTTTRKLKASGTRTITKG